MLRLRTIPAASISLVAAWLSACGGDYRRDFDEDGFEHGASVDNEGMLGWVLTRYHVPHDQVRCMVDEAFTAPRTTMPPGSGGATFNFTADELNTYAATCGVDVTTLWYMTD